MFIIPDRRMSSCVITNTAAPDIRTFPMLLELLSTDLTSLNQDVDRLAVVIDMIVAQDGSTTCAGIYRALVRNRATFLQQRWTLVGRNVCRSVESCRVC